MTHRVCDNIGEEGRFLIEAAEDQLTDHQAEVEVECGEAQLVRHFVLKCKTRTHAKRSVQTYSCKHHLASSEREDYDKDEIK